MISKLCLKMKKRIEQPDRVLDIVEDFLEFTNGQNQEGKY